MRRLVSTLLWLYPATFRRAFAADVLATFDDRWRETGSKQAGLRIIANLLSSAALEHVSRMFHGMDRRGNKPANPRRNPLGDIGPDLRVAFRTLLKSPGFAAVAVITLALGIGVNTAIFSVFYAALLRPLPYDRPEQLGLIWSNFQTMGAPRGPASPILFRELRRRNRLLRDVAGIWVGNGTFTGEANPEQVKVAFVTPNFLDLLGVRPALGGVFGRDEEDGHPAVILSDGLWRRRFGGDPSIVGKGVQFEGASATVIGVLSPDFQLHFPADSNVPTNVQAFMPFGYDIYKQPVTLHYLRMVGRLKPGVTFELAQQDLTIVSGQIRNAYRDVAAENIKFELFPMHRDSVRDIRPALIALFVGAGLVLLICCVNVANLLLARATGRRKEIALRCALGASQVRIVRQLLTEGLLLSAIAGVAGLALGWAGIQALIRLQPDYVARLGAVGLNWPVLAFTATVSLASVVLFGLAPSIESIKWDLIKALREGGRDSRTPARRGVRAVLVVSEVMLSFVLVIGAGLVIRTFANIEQVQPGFQARNLLTFEIELPYSRYASASARMNFVRDWEAQLAGLPEVEAVGATSHLPLDDYPNWYSPYRPEGMSKGQAGSLLADHRCVTSGYLGAMGTKLIAGRYFDDRDRAGGRQVVIVDEMLARMTWPGQSAIGKKIESEHVTDRGFQPVWAEVVGVIEHIRNHSLSKQLRAEIYVPFEQSPRSHLSYVLRTRVEPLSLADPVRQLLHARDRELAVSKLRPMSSYVERAAAPMSFTALLAGIFAGLALFLAAIGIYGVLYYSVSRRMHEMGVRMALGASGPEVMRLVMREGLLLSGMGVALGLAGALFTSSYFETLVYGITPTDPVTYAIATGVISVAAVIGCWRPAWKAATANPADAIRSE